MFTKIATALNSLLGFMNGGKTITGVLGMVAGYAVYILSSYGVTPADPTGLGKEIVDVIMRILMDGGAVLTALGLGHKMGKETP